MSLQKKKPRSAMDTALNLHSKARIASLEEKFQHNRNAALINQNPPNLPNRPQYLEIESPAVLSPPPKNPNAYPILESLQKAKNNVNFYSPQGPLLTVVNGGECPHQPAQFEVNGTTKFFYQSPNNFAGNFPCVNGQNPNEYFGEKGILTPKGPFGFNKENYNAGIGFLTADNKKSTILLPNFKNNRLSSGFEDTRLKRVGDFEFLKDPSNIIGSGTFSVVYAGNHYLKKSMKVAIKVIDTFKCAKALVDEIYITKSIKNANVVNIFDYFIDQKKAKCYLVLEFCNQGSLETCKPKPGLDLSFSSQLKTLYGYFQQILSGLKPLYEMNIIHRDLKLSNILVSDGVVKISDFGFAKHMGKFSQMNSIKCGTPSTMAPEIIFEENTYVNFNKKSDIWSLGVMLHELVYGVHPFDLNANDMQKGKRVRVKTAYPLAEDFIDRALKYDVGQRMSWEEVFSHPINFLDDDEAFLHNSKAKPFFTLPMMGSNLKRESNSRENVLAKGRHPIKSSKGERNRWKRNNEEFQVNLLVILVVILISLLLYRLLFL